MSSLPISAMSSLAISDKAPSASSVFNRKRQREEAVAGESEDRSHVKQQKVQESSSSSALNFQSQALQNHVEYLLPHLHRDLIPIILEYMIEVFGSEEWEKYFGVDVGRVPNLPISFFKFWYGPDPIHKGKAVCETHLPPVFRPENVTHKGKIQPYNLELLGEIVQKPKEGNPLQFRGIEIDFFQPVRVQPAEPACWIVMRNDDVVGRDHSYDDQVKPQRC